MFPQPPDQRSAFQDILTGVKRYLGINPLSPEAQQILSTLQSAPGAKLKTGFYGHQVSTSPLGYPEVEVPWNMQHNGYNVLGVTTPAWNAAKSDVYDMPEPVKELLRTYYGNDPAVVYAQHPAPGTLSHERIHVGQHLSEYPNTNQSLMERLLINAKAAGLVRKGALMKSPNEIPAYSFADPGNYNPEDFAAYMDDVHMRAPKPWGLEASMPKEEMEKYLKTHPVPYNKAPKIKMEPR